MTLHDKIEAVKTYFVGVSAMTVPWLISTLNPVLQFVSLVLGLYLVITRIINDREDRKGKNGH